MERHDYRGPQDQRYGGQEEGYYGRSGQRGGQFGPQGDYSQSGQYGRQYGQGQYGQGPFGSGQYEHETAGQYGQGQYGQRPFGPRDGQSQGYEQGHYGQEQYGQGQYGQQYGPYRHGSDSHRGIGQAAQYGFKQIGHHGSSQCQNRGNQYGYDSQGYNPSSRPQYGSSTDRYRPGHEPGHSSGSQQGAWGEGEWGWSDDVRSVGRAAGDYEMKRGRGPKNYKRSDDRIKEEISDQLMMSPDIDAGEVEIQVERGEVKLTGTVSDRHDKQAVERIAESVLGVDEVMNQIRVKRESGTSSRQGKSESEGSGPAGSQHRTGSGTGEESGYGSTVSSASGRNKTTATTTSR